MAKHSLSAQREEPSHAMAGSRRLPDAGERSYPLVLDTDCRLAGDGWVAGGGRTMEITRSTVRIHTECEFRPGQRIELSIAWPVARPRNTRVRLAIDGEVLDAAEGWAAVAIRNYDFIPDRRRVH